MRCKRIIWGLKIEKVPLLFWMVDRHFYKKCYEKCHNLNCFQSFDLLNSCVLTFELLSLDAGDPLDIFPCPVTHLRIKESDQQVRLWWNCSGTAPSRQMFKITVTHSDGVYSRVSSTKRDGRFRCSCWNWCSVIISLYWHQLHFDLDSHLCISLGSFMLKWTN